jgi:hypothetical protein
MPSSYQTKTRLPDVLQEKKYLLLFQKSSKVFPLLLLNKMDLGEIFAPKP